MSLDVRARWNLVLGRFAEGALGPTSGETSRMARALDYLYTREYRGRRTRIPGAVRESTAGDAKGVLTVPEWVREVRELFPRETAETVTQHALERYEMTELVTDARVLESMPPSYELLRAILTFRGMMSGQVLEAARRIVREVVADLRKQLETEARRALGGRADRTLRTRQRLARNLDLARTLRASLRHYDAEAMRLRAVDLRFFARHKRYLPWDVLLCVDCSGSMLDSVIHASVMAGIFHGLPALRCRLLAFDVDIVDLTEHVADPVEILMSVQLGGGTDIARAMAYCARLVIQPSRTIVVLITDFFEGGDHRQLLATIKELCGAGVRVFALAALDADAEPRYDHGLAAACAAAGADVAALTPKRLCEWMARVMH